MKQSTEGDNSEERKFPRVTITRRGMLTVEDDAAALTTTNSQFPCLIDDMNDGGFLLICTEPFAVGQLLQFRCELLPDQMLECKIKVIHVGDSTIGTKIVEIDEKGIALCQSFMRDQLSTQQLKKSIESLKSAANRQTKNDS